jgi:hypothetical protein
MALVGCTAYQVQCDLCQVQAPAGLDQTTAQANATTAGFVNKQTTSGPSPGQTVWVCQTCKALINS